MSSNNNKLFALKPEVEDNIIMFFSKTVTFHRMVNVCLTRKKPLEARKENRCKKWVNDYFFEHLIFELLHFELLILKSIFTCFNFYGKCKCVSHLFLSFSSVGYGWCTRVPPWSWSLGLGLDDC